MSIDKCTNCGKETIKHAKGMCTTCYKRIAWKPSLKSCKRCGRELPNHARGFCGGCYNSVFHLEKNKELNAKKAYNILPELYRKIVSKCIICEFNKIVEIHHLDHNKQNNSETNLLGLCPNHHKMIHSIKWQKEVFNQLSEKGFKVPEAGYKTDGFIQTIRQKLPKHSTFA